MAPRPREPQHAAWDRKVRAQGLIRKGSLASRASDTFALEDQM